METACDARVWTTKPKLRPIGQTTRQGGRPTKNPKPLKKPQRVAELVTNLPASAWKRMTVAEGSQGPRLYEYVEIPVWFSEQSRPTDQRERLLVRRSVGQDSEIKYQRSNAPAEIPLKKLAEVGGSRWCIEKNFQSGKGECGLDEYETRGWIGWHHHTCLSMLALLFLTLQKQLLGKKHPGLTVPEVRNVLRHLLYTRGWTAAELVQWSQWRMARNRIAKHCHEQRRRKELRRRTRKRKQSL
ncbi:MAG: hypothetical protein ABIK07_23405 [Planctomycetota bacterium]